MADHHEGERDAGKETPFWQRVYDNPFLLLVAGILVMVVFYTLWGLWEVTSLPEATLP